MSLESITWIKDMVITNPTSTDLKSEGDDHIRGIKTALKNQFPNWTSNTAITATEAQINTLVTLVPSVKKMLYGQVNSAGTPIQGTGYTITKGTAGIYTINFTSAFTVAPSVTANVLFSYGVCNVMSVSTTSAQINITDMTSNMTNNAFLFQVLGA